MLILQRILNCCMISNEKFVSPLLYKKGKRKGNGIYKTLNVPLLNPKFLKNKVVKSSNKLKKMVEEPC